ncbi:hypothetical protein OkiPb00197_37760 [Escherichia coli]|uniref:T3SS effector NleG family protein n=1 Tax=Escherichia coli TaxID=562 RepID=UPI000C1B242B|nr:T3SS effector NleG family protein [Escherichia coli]PIM61296.1 hypothetical protein CTI77_23285 [Escherichia coli]TJU69723.1 DUF1076 domain-containing protein [Escherichia coli]
MPFYFRKECPLNSGYLNAGDSDVCTLYDKESLKHLVNTSSPHPLSREKITESMIVKENSCYFDFTSGSIKNVRGEITRL